MTPHQDPADFVYLIPKFHLPAHIPSCHVKFSFNKTPHIGEMDGEAPKCSWSQLNQLAVSLKVMGPGGYLDTLDDHIGDYNYRKSALMGTSSLLRAMLEAIPTRTLHSAIYAEFTASLPLADVQLWMVAIEGWEQDPSNAVHPFETTVLMPCLELTMSKVRLTLAQEEATEIAKITAREIQEREEGAAQNNNVAESTAKDDSEDIFAVCHKVGPSLMILQGVELEFTEGLNRLRWHMDTWFEVQQVYMQGVAIKHGLKVSLEEALDAVTMLLFLPSACLEHRCQNQKLMDFEFRLWEAEAYECLMTMRRLLIYRSHLYKFKDKHVTRQMMSTRARSTVSNVLSNIDEATTRYRTLRSHLVVLAGAIEGGKPDWDRQLQELSSSDVQPLKDVLPGETEGQRAMSWIWCVHRHETDAKETAEALRIEWCKTRARAHCWHKETILLEEEMK
ncbi:hypothetical protein ARMGADRAFT_942823 [Armillaria gallica]|uniref:Uncharacterized protein n=1 Tax=Armillaria gallica TaxID=47427 RepID=A0A2H3CTZ0_ARMGA|nr:hypothetical protein ARMGADRAFT_942823 [Armillaria gallica]